MNDNITNQGLQLGTRLCTDQASATTELRTRVIYTPGEPNGQAGRRWKWPGVGLNRRKSASLARVATAL